MPLNIMRSIKNRLGLSRTTEKSGIRNIKLEGGETKFKDIYEPQMKNSANVNAGYYETSYMTMTGFFHGRTAKTEVGVDTYEYTRSDYIKELSEKEKKTIRGEIDEHVNPEAEGATLYNMSSSETIKLPVKVNPPLGSRVNIKLQLADMEGNKLGSQNKVMSVVGSRTVVFEINKDNLAVNKELPDGSVWYHAMTSIVATPTIGLAQSNTLNYYIDYRPTE